MNIENICKTCGEELLTSGSRYEIINGFTHQSCVNERIFNEFLEYERKRYKEQLGEKVVI